MNGGQVVEARHTRMEGQVVEARQTRMEVRSSRQDIPELKSDRRGKTDQNEGSGGRGKTDQNRGSCRRGNVRQTIFSSMNHELRSGRRDSILDPLSEHLFSLAEVHWLKFN